MRECPRCGKLTLAFIKAFGQARCVCGYTTKEYESYTDYDKDFNADNFSKKIWKNKDQLAFLLYRQFVRGWTDAGFPGGNDVKEVDFLTDNRVRRLFTGISSFVLKHYRPKRYIF